MSDRDQPVSCGRVGFSDRFEEAAEAARANARQDRWPQRRRHDPRRHGRSTAPPRTWRPPRGPGAGCARPLHADHPRRGRGPHRPAGRRALAHLDRRRHRRPLRRRGRAPPGVVVRRARRPRRRRGDSPFDPASWYRWMVAMLDGAEPVPTWATGRYRDGLLYVLGQDRAFYVRSRRPRARRSSAVGAAAGPPGRSNASRPADGGLTAAARRRARRRSTGRSPLSSRTGAAGCWLATVGGSGHGLPRLHGRQRRPAPHRRGPRRLASAACSGCSTATCWCCPR